MENRPYQKRIDASLLPSTPVRLPTETIGVCDRCHQIAELGDGFCLKCWDKGASKKKIYPNIRYKRAEE